MPHFFVFKSSKFSFKYFFNVKSAREALSQLFTKVYFFSIEVAELSYKNVVLRRKCAQIFIQF